MSENRDLMSANTTKYADELIELAKQMQRVTDKYRQTRERLRESVRAAIDAGMSEAEVSRQSGVSRLTVRRWTGKNLKQ